MSTSVERPSQGSLEMGAIRDEVDAKYLLWAKRSHVALDEPLIKTFAKFLDM